MTRSRPTPILLSDPFLLERTETGLRFPLLHQVPALPVPPSGRAATHAFDFDSIADATFLGCFAADTRRPNLLLQCGLVDMPTLVPRLAVLCAGPVRHCRVGSALPLPETDPATLILHDVSRLSVSQQIDLFDWIVSRAGVTQIVSISSVPLAALVDEGRFLQGLFHRLCIVQAGISRRLGTEQRAPAGRHLG